VRTLERRPRPKRWVEHRQGTKAVWVPLVFTEWACAYMAFWLSRWAFLEVLEYVGSLSVLVAVIFWVSEAGERTQQRHYQAWQVINTAQGKGGNGGRIDAMEQLTADGVSLTGVDVSGAFLRNVRLEKAELARADFSGADMRGADLKGANVSEAEFERANLREADLSGANVDKASFADADLTRAELRGVVGWERIGSVKGADVSGVRDAPAGFVEWAVKHGAVAGTAGAATQK